MLLKLSDSTAEASVQVWTKEWNPNQIIVDFSSCASWLSIFHHCETTLCYIDSQSSDTVNCLSKGLLLLLMEQLTP